MTKNKVYKERCPNTFMIGWSEEEVGYLKRNYSNKTNKELQTFLKRSSRGIYFQAAKFKLKKDNETCCRSRKHKDIEVTKELLEKLYVSEEKSIRKIARELNLGKNTISHYLIKYNLKRRTISEAGKIFYSRGGKIWKTGLTKDTDKRVFLAIEKMKRTKQKKKEEKTKDIEKRIGMPLNEAINKLYWKDNLTQEKISNELGIRREEIIKLMKEYDISKKSNFRVIMGLKGEKHPMYGKKWEDIYGVDGAQKWKKEYSLKMRQNIIRRLENNQMPFLNTKIEKRLGAEMQGRNLNFIAQYNIDDKFACDFAIPKYKIIIECDGDYWHANPNFYDRTKLDKRQSKNLARDKFKDIYLKKKGWLVLRFFESEIEDSVAKCVDKIEGQIKKVSNPFDNLEKTQ